MFGSFKGVLGHGDAMGQECAPEAVGAIVIDAVVAEGGQGKVKASNKS